MDFKRLHGFHEGGALFVTRTQRGVLFRRRYSHPIDTSTGVRSDHTVVLASAALRQHYPDPLRRNHYHDAEQDRSLRFLTNSFDLPALTICLLYKCRWQVEIHASHCTSLGPSDSSGSNGCPPGSCSRWCLTGCFGLGSSNKHPPLSLYA